MRINRPFLLGMAVTLAGCHTGTLPNPNDPKDVGSITIENLKDQLGCVSDLLMSREMKQQIDDKQYHELMAVAAAQLLTEIDPDKVDVSKQWELAKVMMTANQWEQAKPLLEASAIYAKQKHNDDAWVNATLLLAQVEARLDKIPEALKTARSVFTVQPSGAAPILYGVYYDISPVVRGKGHDVELARLLEDAMVIDLHVYIDPKFVSGRDFLKARPAHLRQAWHLIQELYQDANRPDLEDAAKKRLGATGTGFDTNTEVRV